MRENDKNLNENFPLVIESWKKNTYRQVLIENMVGKVCRFAYSTKFHKYWLSKTIDIRQKIIKTERLLIHS